MTGIYKIVVHNPFCWHKPMSWIAWIIRKATGSHWNHAALLISDYVYEAQTEVVRHTFDEWMAIAPDREYQLIPVFKSYETKEYATFVNTSLASFQIRQRAEAQLGKKYNYINTCIWQPIYLLTGRWIGRTAEWAYDRFECFQFVDYCLGFATAYKSNPKEN